MSLRLGRNRYEISLKDQYVGTIYADSVEAEKVGSYGTQYAFFIGNDIIAFIWSPLEVIPVGEG